MISLSSSGPQRAIDAQGIDTESFQHIDHRLRITARKGAAAALIGHRDKYGQITVFFRGQHAGLDFIQIAHGLKQDHVDFVFGAVDHVLKQRVGFIKL